MFWKYEYNLFIMGKTFSKTLCQKNEFYLKENKKKQFQY